MTPRETARHKPWRWIGGLLLVWCFLAVVVVVIVGWTGARRRDAALEELRAAGQPLLPGDLRSPVAATGSHSGAADAERWLATFPPPPEDDEDDAAQSVTMFAGLVHLRMSGYASVPSSDPSLVEIEKVPECAALLAECGNDVDVFWARVDAALDHPSTLENLRACCASAIRLRLAAHDPNSVAAALTSCGVSPLDAQTVFAVMEHDDQPFPKHEAQARAGRAVDLLCAKARADVLAGHATESLQALEAAFCAVRTISELPWMEAQLAWEIELLKTLDALRQCLSLLPTDADFSAIQTSLAQLEPRERFVRALQGQRALANRLYLRRAQGKSVGVKALDEQPFLTSWIADLFLARDQADCLTLFTERIAAAQAPINRGATAAARADPANLLIGPVLAENSPDNTVTELEARIALTQLALIARRDGLDAARTAANEKLDPFNGLPIRSRSDKDGMLVLWSVGQDGKDNGGDPTQRPGSSSTSDIVVGVLPRDG